MSQKRNETLIYSSVGVVAMFLIVVALNFIFSLTNARIDLTEEKLYTLSDGTKEILAELDTPIEVRFYATQDDKIMPPSMKVYARRVESMLREYQELSNGHLVIRKFDPEPNSDAEDSARLDGISSQPISLGESIYLGVAISMLDRTAALPFLPPNREQLLEYDLSRAISQVVKAEKPVVGVMSALPVMGMPMNPMMMRMGQQGSQPWALISELQRDFEIREIPLAEEQIDEDVKVLLLIHPKDISEGTQYAIDQFILRGGRLIAMLDPMAISDQQPQAQQNPMGPPPSPSTLDKLLPAWGLDFDNTKVVADMTLARELQMGRQPPQLVPTFLFVGPENIDREDVSTAQIDDVWMPFPGAFSGTPVDGLEQTVLMHTSDQSQAVEGFLAQMAPQQIAKDFVASGTEMPLAIRLSGRFKTAFPDGKPGLTLPPDGDEESETATSADNSLKESAADGVVVLIGDVDMANDNFSVRQILPGMFAYQNGNISLIQSLAEQLAGDSRLIGSRSRATMNRPFTAIRELEVEAEKKGRDAKAAVEKQKQDAERRLNEILQGDPSNQGVVLSAEIQKEQEALREKVVEANREIRMIDRELRKDVKRMENRIKLYNIAGMPALIILVGIIMAIMKNKRTAAK